MKRRKPLVLLLLAAALVMGGLRVQALTAGQSAEQSAGQSTEQSAEQDTDQGAGQSNDQDDGQSADQDVDQSAKDSADQDIDQSAEQSAQTGTEWTGFLALALASDTEYTKLLNEIAIQEKDLQQALDAAGISEEDCGDCQELFRLALEEGESLSEYFSALSEPALLLVQLRVTEAEKNSREQELAGEIAGLCIRIMTVQERISVQEEALEVQETLLTKTRALVLSGEEASSQLEEAEAEAEELTKALEAEQDELEEAMDELAALLGEEAAADELICLLGEEKTTMEGLLLLIGEETSGEMAFADLTAEDTLWEDSPEELIQWAMENDAGCLAAERDCLEALLKLWTEYTVFNEEYAVPDNIFEYIVSAVEGETIDTDAFYEEYTAYLKEREAALEQQALTQARAMQTGTGTATDADEKSGETAAESDGTDAGTLGTSTESGGTDETTGETAADADGTDAGTEESPDEEEKSDSYALYDLVLEYLNTVLTLEDQKAALTESVEEAYEDFVSLCDTYTELQEQIEEMEKDLKLYQVRYRLGELTKEEYQSLTDQTEALELEILNARSEYWQAYYSLNSISNGGLSAQILEELETRQALEETEMK
ncbi:MAG: TolC family protein [Lachnospiraceae bacterium]|nr:TolC family protein [Lachnospiraceae bacterium]